MVDEENDNPPPNIVTLEDGDDASHHSIPKPDDHTDTVAVGLEEWATAREALARLEVRLESRTEDVSRAVEYARELEAECDRLADLIEDARAATAEAEAELNEERGRSAELRERNAQLIEQLEELSGIRARVHLERGRREEAEEAQQDQQEQIHRLQRRVEELTEALEEAKEAGFTAEVGALTIEWKR